ATRRGNPPEIVTALLQQDARDKAFFEQRDRLDVIAARMTTPTRAVAVSRDDEHNAFELTIEERSQGYPRKYKMGVDFVASVDDFVEYFVAAGKKGIAVNRYKGLGEMNPDTLWTTTMDPEIRTLLQVRAEDHAEADQMFTTLMGDQVEPRRKFIEDNALDVRN